MITHVSQSALFAADSAHADVTRSQGCDLSCEITNLDSSHSKVDSMTKATRVLPGLLLAFSMAAVVQAADGTWTDAKDETLPADFAIQGEYTGKLGDQELGAQVIALGKGAFQAVLYPGGLPGDGWDGKSRILMDGTLAEDGTAAFKPTEGNRKYLAGNPKEFAAVDNFPPEGNAPYTGTVSRGVLSGKTDGGKAFELKRIERKSPTMGAEAPEGAVVLFNGENKDAWTGGRVDESTKLLNTDGRDILTTAKFMDYTMHLEFLLPYRPDARGQGRGNSGFYQVDHYEVQILDSFGLMGKNNECGGIYSKSDSLVNGCLPPLQWQTYDVVFTNAKADKDGKKISNAKLTAKLNGIVIHDGLEITGKTGGSRSDAEGTPGPIKLQGHGNPLQFRNVWIVPTPAE